MGDDIFNVGSSVDHRRRVGTLGGQIGEFGNLKREALAVRYVPV